jgi:hypothetical protein
MLEKPKNMMRRGMGRAGGFLIVVYGLYVPRSAHIICRCSVSLSFSMTKLRVSFVNMHP